MEAVRPRTDHRPSSSAQLRSIPRQGEAEAIGRIAGSRSGLDQDTDAVDVLPPPPEPFPLDQLRPSPSEGRTESEVRQPRQAIRGYLLSVQQSCVNALSSLLPLDAEAEGSTSRLLDSSSNSLGLGDDTQLAAALSDLLEVTYELDDLLPPTPNHITPSTVHSATFDPDLNPITASFDVLADLLGGLHEARTAEGEGQTIVSPEGPNGHGLSADRDGGQVQDENGHRGTGTSERLHPAINVVREELAWARLESLTSAVLQLSKERSARPNHGHEHGGTTTVTELRASRTSGMDDGLPPSYDEHDGVRDSDGSLPSYQDLHSSESQNGAEPSPRSNGKEAEREKHASRDDASGPRAQEAPSAHREKMLQELDAVTAAIERLASIAPRLHDQRVELRPSARALGANGNADVDGSGSERHKMTKEDKARLERIKMKELEEIWDKIERAHGKRRIRVEEGQRADKEEWERRRRERFLNKLVEQSEASRLNDQESAMGSVNAELARARDLRDRDHFLRDLIDQSGERRLEDQDAIEGTTNRQDKRQAFISEIVSRTRASRMVTQDFPLTVEDRLAERRASYIESLMDYSGSGRLHDQDSLPPTPLRGANGDKVEDPFELVTVQDFLASTGPSAAETERVQRSSLSADLFMRPCSRNGSASGESAAMGRSRSNSVPLDEGITRKSTSASGSTTPTTLKKIAGMMRRGSGHLGLKATTGLDMGNIAFIAEHQENLRSVLVTLHGVGVSANLELQIDAGSGTDDEATVTSKRDPTISLKVGLPVPVLPGQTVAFVAQQLHLEAKLVAKPTPPSAVSLLPTYALGASDLRVYHPRGLCCTSCERELATLPRLRDRHGCSNGHGHQPADVDQDRQRQSSSSSTSGGLYKDLPSEHWAEMMEVWMCHDDPAFTARLAAQTKEGFWPRDGDVLVGGSHLLLGRERVKEGNIRVQPIVGEPWNPITCVCGETIGKQRASDDQPGSGTVRFSKWAIALLGDGEDDDANAEPIRFPLSVFVVSDMLELSQAHASHRFIIADEESGEKRIYVWLFNPSVRLSYRRPLTTASTSPLRASHAVPMSVSKSSGSKSRRSSAASIHVRQARSQSHSRPGSGPSRVLKAAKIMYKVVDANQAELESLPGFGAGGQVEHLTYPRAVCERLTWTLMESTMLYPISRRTMGAFDIGFLERV